MEGVRENLLEIGLYPIIYTLLYPTKFFFFLLFFPFVADILVCLNTT